MKDTNPYCEIESRIRLLPFHSSYNTFVIGSSEQNCAHMTEKSSSPRREPAVNGEIFDISLLAAESLILLAFIRQVSLQGMVVAV